MGRRTTAVVLAAAGAMVTWPASGVAQYSFWTGTTINQVTGENRVDPNRPLVLKPGLTPEAAAEIAGVIRKNMPNLNPFGPQMEYSNNPFGDRYTTHWEKGRTYDGYTLLTMQRLWVDPDDHKEYGALLFDMDGTLVNKWELRGCAKMLPGGSVMGGMGTSADPIGWPYLVQQSWCGADEWFVGGAVEDAWPAEKAWVARTPGGELPLTNNRCSTPRYDVTARTGLPYGASNLLGCRAQVLPGDLVVSGWHHDYQREGNPVGYAFPGAKAAAQLKRPRTLILSFHVPPTCTGDACISRYRLQDAAIYILDYDGKTRFAWRAADHFDEMGFLPAAREAIREMLRGGQNPESASDYQHFNTVDWVGPNKWWDAGDLHFNPEYIIWDARQTNITAIIATSDHPRGEWRSGDIVWKIGPNYQYPYDEEAKLGQIIGQHQVHMIPKGLPGAGNMLLFDNGGGAGWGPLFEGAPLLYDPADPLFLPSGQAPASRVAYNNRMSNFSRVIEFDPITLDVVWEYSQPNPTADVNGDGKIFGNERLFYSFFISGMQRLGNGNTLITEGATGRVFEVTPKKEVVWEFIAPTDFEGGGAGIPTRVGRVYRSYRIPYDWVPRDPRTGRPVQCN